MNYLTWREGIFVKLGEPDPGSVPWLPELFELSLEEHFDHIDRALCDPEIHVLYSRDQIGIGLKEIYSPANTEICDCYVRAGDEARRIAGIRNLDHLYTNYFDRYCVSPVQSVGNSSGDGQIGHICYMLWDIFVLNPFSASPAMADAAVDVMAKALRMTNDNCIASAIHGLGHWVPDSPRAKDVLEDWLQHPTTANPELIAYAEQATTGYIQ